ncbi:MAG: hypothetical protein ACUVXF_00600 [Desulfobaccales bacterium]
MKKVLVILMLLSLGGCATISTAPPAGCENSLVWQCGFMPQGKEVVELAFAALLTAAPELKNPVKKGALKGWRLVQDGTLGGAVAELMVLLEKHSSRYTPLARFALQRLDLDQALNKCDQEVFLALFRNIALYAGAEDQDFRAPLTELASPGQ